VAFDKTGTLTEGHPEVTFFKAQAGSEDALLALAASLQAASSHPLAKALVRAAQAKNLALQAVDGVQAIPGNGSTGRLVGSTATYLLGRAGWVQDMGGEMTAWADDLAAWEAAGASVSVLAVQDAPSSPQPGQGAHPPVRVLAAMGFADRPKAGAKEAIAALKARGIKTVMISGDNWGAASAVGRTLGFDVDGGEVMAQVLPEDKIARVIALKEGGKQVVAMVGDGINDAPALAAADVGLAMGNGTDVAMRAASITLMRGDPRLVVSVLDISKRTVAKIRQNLFWAFAYNVAGIPLAAMGLLSPVVAGAAMAFSSVTVMCNALLLKWMKPKPNAR
jgi:Cu+-exporting ATPase